MSGVTIRPAVIADAEQLAPLHVQAIRFYEQHCFAFDGTRRSDPYGTESRMARS